MLAMYSPVLTLALLCWIVALLKHIAVCAVLKGLLEIVNALSCCYSQVLATSGSVETKTTRQLLIVRRQSDFQQLLSFCEL